MKYLIILLSLSLFSCSSLNRITGEEQNSGSYASSETGKLSSLSKGVILSIKKVKLSGSKGLGTALGTALGGLAGQSSTDKKYNQEAATAVAGLLGAVIGSKLEEGITAEDGYEFIIDTKEGAKVLVEKTRGDFQVGDKVYIIYGEKVRLTKSNF